MKGYKDISLRLIKSNKKRNISIIFSIILCVFITFGVMTFYENIRVNIFNESKKYGDYMASFSDVSEANYNELKNNININKSCAYKEQKASINRKKSEEKLSVNVLYMYDTSQDVFKYNLIEGTYPENCNEIMLEKNLLSKLEKNYNVGDNIILQVQDENSTVDKTYKITGFFHYEKNENGTFNEEFKAISTLCDSNYKESMKVFVSYKDYSDIEKSTQNISKDYSIKIDSYNNDVLSALGQGKYNDYRNTILKVIGIIAIILIAEIIIRNSFFVSVKENVANIGTLKCIGASNKHIRNILFKYAFIIGMFSIVAGIVISYFSLKLIIYFANRKLNNIFNFEMNFYSSIALISGIIIFISIMLSVLEPIKYIKKISLVDCINGSVVSKNQKIKKRRSVAIRKIFGIEAEYAYKNIMRNNYKFFIRVVATIISILIVIIVNTICNTFLYEGTANANVTKGYYDAIVTKQNGEIIDNDKEELEKVSGVYKARKIEYSHCFFPSDSMKYTDDFINKYPENISKINSISIRMVQKDEMNAFNDYVVEGKIDGELNDDEVIFVDYGNNEGSYILNKNIKMREAKAEDKVTLLNYDYLNKCNYFKLNDDEKKNIEKEAFNLGEVKDYKIKAILKADPLYGMSNYNGCVFYVSPSEYNNAKNSGRFSIADNYYQYLIKFCENNNIDNLQNYVDSSAKYTECSYISPYIEINNYLKTIKLYANIICTIVIFISIFNIINTTISNERERQKEFAMFRVVGMSKKKIFKMMLFESSIVGLLSILISIIGGIITSYFIIDKLILYNFDNWTFCIPYKVIVLMILLLIIISITTAIITIRNFNDYDICSKIKDN